MKVAFVLLWLGMIKSVLLYRGYHILPGYELKRRARAKDHDAAALYKTAARPAELDMLLYTTGILCAGAAIIMAARTSWWAAALSVLFTAWLLIFAPQPKVGGLVWRLCVFAGKPTFKLVNWLYIFLHPLAKVLIKDHRPYTGVYEKEDLLDLLKHQAQQSEGNIREEDLKIATGALTFGDKKVGEVMTPRRKARFVSENEAVGPMLMDELHATGLSRFAVTSDSAKTASPKVTGTLYIKDLIERQGSAKVREVMSKRRFFINESCSLHQALDAFVKSHHHLLVVVNNFEEVSGVLMLEDVLEQILGRRITDEFDKYDDLHAVAGLDDKKSEPKQPAEPPKPKDKTEAEQ